MLQMTQVGKVYADAGCARPVLHQVDLTVARGSFLAILGRSGSGKSTLLNLLGCLDRPTHGQYRIDGVPFEHASRAALCRVRASHFGFVFQAYNLLEHYSVKDNICLPLRYAAVSPAAAASAFDDAVENLGLDRLLGKPVRHLSGGEQQRVAIARALMNRPAFLLADEPTGALDQEAGATVMALFKRLHQNGTGIIMVTHDPQMAAHAEQQLKMVDGRPERCDVMVPMHAV
ncbi:ABC transporter ATP-binding protein [Pseudomonas sp. NPDC089752]|uniref:ABC transporter ATP-binding protein n=1 Tax=Pseudomonas sp. NPDC089752 TaxID=3364472 RepID=UPI0037FEA7F1